MKLTTTTRNGQQFVLVPVDEYRKLTAGDLPPLPPVDEDGTSNAVEFARASIARSLIQDRRAAGLTQQQLATLAGVRQESISRIESGKHTATVKMIEKIDRALHAATRGKSRRAG